MNIRTNQNIRVAIHSVTYGGWISYTVFAGHNPHGPRGGHSGRVVDAEQISDKPHSLPVALRIARHYAEKTGAELVLTDAQQLLATK